MFHRPKEVLTMLREPRRLENVVQVQKTARKGPFQIVRLEERIAPSSHTNPQGKPVGSGGHHGGKI
jgi:hypothetical protein